MAPAQGTVQPGVIGTDTATTDITQYRFVSGAGTHCGAGERATGISMVGVTSGSPFSVVWTGSFLIELGGAANANDEIEADINGCGIPLTTGKSNGILLASGSTGDKVPLLIK